MTTHLGGINIAGRDGGKLTVTYLEVLIAVMKASELFRSQFRNKQHILDGSFERSLRYYS